MRRKVGGDLFFGKAGERGEQAHWDESWKLWDGGSTGFVGLLERFKYIKKFPSGREAENGRKKVGFGVHRSGFKCVLPTE